MNHLHRLLIASTLGLSLAGNALADRGDHREQRDNRVVIRSVDGGHHHHHDNRHPQRATRNHWLGPAAVLAIGGLTLGAIAYNSPPRPVIYSAPPPPNVGSWYFCRSSGQYYPYTQACPEGWQAVAPQ